MFKCNRNLTVTTPKTFLKNTSSDYNIFFGPPDSDDVSLSSIPACPKVELPAIKDLAISAKPFAFLTAEIPIQFNPSVGCAQCQQQEDTEEGRDHRAVVPLTAKENFTALKGMQ